MINIYIGKQKTSPLTPLLQGEGNQNVEKVDVLEKNVSQLFDEIQTPSLFGEKKTFILRNVFENESIKKDIYEKLEDVENAPHDVIILADKLLVADKKVLDKVGTIHESKEKEAKTESFNPFGLANAFATGDKKKTWIMFQEVAHHSDEMEPTHGMIWWKLKSMPASRDATQAKERIELARKLVAVYHEARLGGLSMSERLEEFFLTMPDKK